VLVRIPPAPATSDPAGVTRCHSVVLGYTGGQLCGQDCPKGPSLSVQTMEGEVVSAGSVSVGVEG